MWENLLETLTSQAGSFFLGYGFAILEAVAALIIGLWIVKLISKPLHKAVHGVIDDEAIAQFLNSLLTICMKGLVYIVAASVLGVETASFLAIIGSAGLAVGFALQGSLSNLASGLIILIFKPFKKGDLVVVNGHLGYIEKIEMLSTTIYTRGKKAVIFPNSKITNGFVENYSKEKFIRRTVDVVIGYDADIPHAKKVILDAVNEQVTTICKAPDPKAFIDVKGLTDRGVLFTIFFWCTDTNFYSVKDPVLLVAKKALQDAGIELPFQQHSIYIKNDKDLADTP